MSTRTGSPDVNLNGTEDPTVHAVRDLNAPQYDRKPDTAHSASAVTQTAASETDLTKSALALAMFPRGFQEVV